MKIETITERPRVRIELDADEAEYLRKIVGNVAWMDHPLYAFSVSLYDELGNSGVKRLEGLSAEKLLSFKTVRS
jgi:hypothetical protein